MEEKEFVFTIGHRNPVLTSTEEIAYREQRQKMAESMIGKDFTYINEKPCGTIKEVWLNEENAFVLKVKCDNAMYDSIMEHLDLMNDKVKSFSIRGVSK